jgi:hypothetical protein
VLPVSPGAIGLAAAAATLVTLLAWRAATTAPVLLLGLVALPWLPIPIPAAFLIWSAPFVVVVWIAVFAILLGSARLPLAWLVRRAAARPALAAGLAACVVYSVAAWQVAPSVPGGDEPHYLVITQSLLYDQDLRIENNHRRGDYHAYFAGELRPDFLRRGRNGEIYSIHAPGVSALVLPAFALGGYRAVVMFLILLASVAAALSWWLAWRVTGRRDAAWFGCAAVVLAPTAVLNAFTVYPDGPGALFVLTGVWALVRARDERISGASSVRPWLLHGAALALLPWLHTRFALLAGGLGALVLPRADEKPVAKASAFLAVPAVSALAWIAPSPPLWRAGSRDSVRGSSDRCPHPGGPRGLLFDQQYGLPAMRRCCRAFAGLVVLRTREFRWLPRNWFVAAPPAHGDALAMWWRPRAPARFFLPPCRARDSRLCRVGRGDATRTRAARWRRC